MKKKEYVAGAQLFSLYNATAAVLFFFARGVFTGVRGIGEKRGSRLLERFGSLEGIFAAVEGVGEMNIRGSKAVQELLR